MGKRVLVTGCSSGIGRALVGELAARGHHVVATARRVESLEGLDAALKLALDVTDPTSVAAAVAAAGPIDVLVNNAGFSLWGVVEAVDDVDLERLFDTNVFGAVRMIRAVLPQMRARRSGAIFQVSSAAARRSTAMLGHYAASKAALDAYSEALRIELAPFRIAVCTVVLGAVESAIGDNRQSVEMSEYDAMMAAARQRVARNRTTPATAEAVARTLSDAIELDRPPVRLDGCGNSFALVRGRVAQGDAEWEDASLTELFGADWKQQFDL
jgi:short-subunit dehydrogenase